MTFKELNIIQPILKAIEEKGYNRPTPIQQQAIPVALSRKDILGCAQTGTGKTASFAIPIIQLLQADPIITKRKGVKALILTPTRELALQISECLDEYARYTPVRHGVMFGGVNQRPQVTMLQKGIDILVATPGRLLDLMSQGFLSLDQVKYFVLDEADRMLDMGFIHDIKRILPKLPKEKQTLFFSATMPDSIVTLASALLKNPVKITITPESPTVDAIEQFVYFVEKAEKGRLLISLLRKAENQSVLVFSRTKHNADRIVRVLGKAGIGSQAIHGNKSQAARQSALGNFKSGKTRVMVATDIAARGIDINELPLVINYDLPDVPETYVHRIGRTGRAGNAGTAFTFCSQEERKLVDNIQKLLGFSFSIPISVAVSSDRFVWTAPLRLLSISSVFLLPGGTPCCAKTLRYVSLRHYRSVVQKKHDDTRQNSDGLQTRTPETNRCRNNLTIRLGDKFYFLFINNSYS